MEWWIDRGDTAFEFTKRRNLNRGYMKLEVWNDAMELFALVEKILREISSLDFRLRGQILDAAQSVSSNISDCLDQSAAGQTSHRYLGSRDTRNQATI